MLEQAIVEKIILTKEFQSNEGSSQYIYPRERYLRSDGIIPYHDEDVEEKEGILSDCPERNMFIYHLLRMVRDLYINSKGGGGEDKSDAYKKRAKTKESKSGAYRKQCRTKRKSALSAILTQSEEPMKFRWTCKVLGFDPIIFRNRVLFDVKAISALMLDGVKICSGREDAGLSRKALTSAEVWLWDESPERYRLSEKKGHFIIKISKEDSETWQKSLENSPLEFTIETFDLTSGNVVLIVRHK